MRIVEVVPSYTYIARSATSVRIKSPSCATVADTELDDEELIELEEEFDDDDEDDDDDDEDDDEDDDDDDELELLPQAKQVSYTNETSPHTFVIGSSVLPMI